jgi:hypothetical protein
MSATSNLAIQTFLELQTIKAMINNTKIELWQEYTTYDANKPLRYNNQLYICNLAHTSTDTFDASKFDIVEASGVDAGNVLFSHEDFTAENVYDALVELLNNGGSSTPASANVTFSNIGFSAQNVYDALVELLGKTGSLAAGSVTYTNANFTATNVRDALTELFFKFGSINPQDIAFSNANFTSDNMKDALIELFQSASSGKSTIATAITGKGQTASGSSSNH